MGPPPQTLQFSNMSSPERADVEMKSIKEEGVLDEAPQNVDSELPEFASSEKDAADNADATNYITGWRLHAISAA